MTDAMTVPLYYGTIKEIVIRPVKDFWEWQVKVSGRVIAQGTCQTLFGALDRITDLYEPWWDGQA